MATSSSHVNSDESDSEIEIEKRSLKSDESDAFDENSDSHSNSDESDNPYIDRKANKSLLTNLEAQLKKDFDDFDQTLGADPNMKRTFQKMNIATYPTTPKPNLNLISNSALKSLTTVFKTKKSVGVCCAVSLSTLLLIIFLTNYFTHYGPEILSVDSGSKTGSDSLNTETDIQSELSATDASTYAKDMAADESNICQRIKDGSFIVDYSKVPNTRERFNIATPKTRASIRHDGEIEEWWGTHCENKKTLELFVTKLQPNGLDNGENRLPNKLDKNGDNILSQTKTISHDVSKNHKKYKMLEKIDLLLYGDSITESWTEMCFGKKSARAFGAKYSFQSGFSRFKEKLALGICGDQTQHLLYRIINGEFPTKELIDRTQVGDLGIDFEISNILVHIGINNVFSVNSQLPIGVSKAHLVVEGIFSVVNELFNLGKKNGVKIGTVYILPLLPGDESNYDTILQVNRLIMEAVDKVEDQQTVKVINCAWELFGKKVVIDGKEIVTADERLMPDMVHPSAKGLQFWAKCISKEILGS